MKVTMEMVADYLARKDIKKHRASRKDVEIILKDLGYMMALESEYSSHSRIYKMLVRQGKKILNEN